MGNDRADANGLFGGVQRLVRIRVLGRELDVPADETLLRAFQYLAPHDVSHGRFCWAGTCGNSAITYRMWGASGAGPEREARACRLLVADGLDVTRLSPELSRALRSVLPAAPAEAAAVSSGSSAPRG